MKNKIKLTSKLIEELDLDIKLEDTKDLYIKRISLDNGDMETEEEGSVSGIISDISIDADGDVILPSAFDFKRFELNPVVLFNHSLSQPIGFVDSLQRDSQSVHAKVKFGSTAEAQKVYQLTKDRVLRTFSVGFITLEEVRKGTRAFNKAIDELKSLYPDRFNDANALTVDRIVTKALLVELSVVTVPSNMNAVISEIKSLKEDKVEEVEQKEIDLQPEVEEGLVKNTKVVDENVTEIKAKEEEVVVEIEEKELDIVPKIHIKKVGELESKIKRVSTIEKEKQLQLNDLYLRNWGV